MRQNYNILSSLIPILDYTLSCVFFESSNCKSSLTRAPLPIHYWWTTFTNSEDSNPASQVRRPTTLSATKRRRWKPPPFLLRWQILRHQLPDSQQTHHKLLCDHLQPKITMWCDGSSACVDRLSPAHQILEHRFARPPHHHIRGGHHGRSFCNLLTLKVRRKKCRFRASNLPPGDNRARQNSENRSLTSAICFT